MNKHVPTPATGDEPSSIDLFAAEFTRMCLNRHAATGMPQEPVARAFVLHGALMIAAIIGAPQCAAELRAMADQIELGNAQVSGTA